MKQTENNEMDLLLRGLAKHPSSVSDTGRELQHDEAHLDADELNAFAERAVPPATRARYMAHIADCSRCRKLVAALTAAAGLPITEIKTEDRAQTSFWQRLPAFLSPSVLRFAVPALAMLVVVTVGIITFQTRQAPDYVAQNRETSTKQVELTPAQETESPQSRDQITTQSSPGRSANSPTVVEQQDKAGEKAIAVDGISAVASPSESLAKDAPKPPPTAPQKADESQPTFAPEPEAAGARPQPSPTREADKNEVARQREEAAGDTATREARDERQAGEDRETLSRSRKAATAGRGGALSSVQAPRTETKQKRADHDADIREVAGRRFQRQGNTWIDIEYDAGRSAMTVVRGSEQYRVLVADEPGIRTIAERLAGEIIVVWKGRAYRIR